MCTCVLFKRCVRVRVDTHAVAYTHTHTHTHTRRHRHTHTLALSHTRLHTHTHTYLCRYSRPVKISAVTNWVATTDSEPCVAACCSVLQCVAVCCSVLQCVAVCCSVLQCRTMSANASQNSRLFCRKRPAKRSHPMRLHKKYTLHKSLWMRELAEHWSLSQTSQAPVWSGTVPKTKTSYEASQKK